MGIGRSVDCLLPGLDGSGAGSPVCLPDAGSRVPGPGSERGGAAARTAAAAAVAVAAARSRAGQA